MAVGTVVVFCFLPIVLVPKSQVLPLSVTIGYFCMLLLLVCTDYAQNYVSITEQDLITALIMKDGSGM